MSCSGSFAIFNLHMLEGAQEQSLQRPQSAGSVDGVSGVCKGARQSSGLKADCLSGHGGPELVLTYARLLKDGSSVGLHIK